MAYNETKASRQRVYIRGGITGTRVWTGSILSLDSIRPQVGDADFPGEDKLEVSQVVVQPETQEADGTNYGMMTVSYAWGGGTGSAQQDKLRNGWRQDEFTISESSEERVTDRVGTAILRWQYDPDTEKWQEVPGTLTIRGGAAALVSHLITDVLLPYEWTRWHHSINEEKFAGFPPGYWLFDGARVLPLTARDPITDNSLNEVWLTFLLNVPGWNKNQFGETDGLPTVDGGVTSIHHYVAYESTNFHSLFPMLYPKQPGSWSIRY